MSMDEIALSLNINSAMLRIWSSVDGLFMLVGSGWLGVARGDMSKMAYPGRNEKNYFHYFRFPRFYAGCRAKKPENRPRTAP